MQFLSIDFEQVSTPAGFAAGGTSQCGLHYTRRVKVMSIAHCLKLNVTIESIVASRRMLPYARDWKTGEGAYDESTKQARVVRRDTTTLSEIKEIREEDNAG